MYKVSNSKGPNLVVNKAWRDSPQNLEKTHLLRGLTRKRSNSPQDNLEIMSAPMPTFHNVGNKNNRASNGRHNPQEPFYPQHQELVKYFNDSWERVLKEYNSSSKTAGDNSKNSDDSDSSNGIAFYVPGRCHPELANFKPFDLEGYWGQKVYTNTTQSR